MPAPKFEEKDSATLSPLQIDLEFGLVMVGVTRTSIVCVATHPVEVV